MLRFLIFRFFFLTCLVSLLTSEHLFTSSTSAESTAPVPSSGQLESSAVMANHNAIDFELEDLSGKKVHLKDFRGKLILLNFWATWCLPCVSEMASLERLFKTYENHGFQIITINVDAKNSVAKVRDFVKAKDLTFPVLLDPEMKLSEQYGLTGYPETFFINPQGKFRLVRDPETNLDTVRLLSDRPWDSQIYLKFVGELLQRERYKRFNRE